MLKILPAELHFSRRGISIKHAVIVHTHHAALSMESSGGFTPVIGNFSATKSANFVCVSEKLLKLRQFIVNSLLPVLHYHFRFSLCPPSYFLGLFLWSPSECRKFTFQPIQLLSICSIVLDVAARMLRGTEGATNGFRSPSCPVFRPQPRCHTFSTHSCKEMAVCYDHKLVLAPMVAPPPNHWRGCGVFCWRFVWF